MGRLFVEPAGQQREEVPSTGRYVLQDVACRACSAQLGWQYVMAEAQDQKYKEKCMLLRLGELQMVNRVTGNCVPGIVDNSAAGAAAAAAGGGGTTLLNTSFHRNVQQPVFDPHGSRSS